MPDLISTAPSAVLDAIRKDLGRLGGEPDSRLNVKDHYNNLLTLAGNLRKLGLDHVVVDAHVQSVFEEYREKLMRHVQGDLAPAADRDGSHESL